MSRRRPHTSAAPVRLLPLICATVAGIVGCGGATNDEPTAPAVLAAPKAKEPFDRARVRIVKTLNSKDCDGLRRLIPEQRTGIKVGKLCTTVQFQLADARTVAAEAYRGGAVIDYEREGKRIPVILFVAADGIYRFSHVDIHVGRASVRTKPTSGADQAAERAVAALVSRDCRRVRSVMHDEIGVGAAPRKAVCAYAKNNPIAGIRDVDPQARAKRLGGNEVYSFYGIATSGVHYTLIVALRPSADGTSQPSDYALVDAIQTNVDRRDEAAG